MMLNNNNNNSMEIPLNNPIHDATGRTSPMAGSAESKNLVSFEFTQEQVECVCEVSCRPIIRDASPLTKLTSKLLSGTTTCRKYGTAWTVSVVTSAMR